MKHAKDKLGDEVELTPSAITVNNEVLELEVTTKKGSPWDVVPEKNPKV